MGWRRSLGPTYAPTLSVLPRRIECFGEQGNFVTEVGSQKSEVSGVGGAFQAHGDVVESVRARKSDHDATMMEGICFSAPYSDMIQIPAVLPWSSGAIRSDIGR